MDYVPFKDVVVDSLDSVSYGFIWYLRVAAIAFSYGTTTFELGEENAYVMMSRFRNDPAQVGIPNYNVGIRANRNSSLSRIDIEDLRCRGTENTCCLESQR